MSSKTKIKLCCPHCKAVISNHEEMEVGKKYKCTKCEGRYFTIKISQILFTLF